MASPQNANGDVTKHERKLPSTSPEREDGNYPNKAKKIEEDMRPSKYEFLCKLLATVLVFIAFIFHLLRGTQEGSGTCSRLLTKGAWRHVTWQPYGCMMHHYHPKLTPLDPLCSVKVSSDDFRDF